MQSTQITTIQLRAITSNGYIVEPLRNTNRSDVWNKDIHIGILYTVGNRIVLTTSNNDLLKTIK